MTKTSVVIATACIALLAAGTASAAGGKGGTGPGSGGSSPGGGEKSGGFGGKDVSAAAEGESPDETEKKSWEIEGVFETHKMVRNNDLNGDANNKFFNFFYLYPKYDITDKDRIFLRAGVYQRFLADEGETGLRLDDTVVGYTRFIPIDKDTLFRVTPWITLPTSFDSKIAGIKTVPRLAGRFDRKFGRITTSAIAYAEYYVATRTAPNGGNPNPISHAAAILEAEFRVPEIEKLFLGASIATGYTWYYGVDSTSPNVNQTGVVGDRQFSQQPVSQTYGGEIFARYEFPAYKGLNSDITLSYAEGDPSLGYTSVLHDGVRQSYFGFNRHVSEFYAALTARY